MNHISKIRSESLLWANILGKKRFQAKEAQGVGKKLQRIEHGLASHQRELWIGPVTRTNHSIVRDLGWF